MGGEGRIIDVEPPAAFLDLLEAAQKAGHGEAATPRPRPEDIVRIPNAHPALEAWMKRTGIEAEPGSDARREVDEETRALWRAIAAMRRPER